MCLRVCKDCELDEYLKSCTCMKSLADNLVTTCDEFEDTSETINSRIYWWKSNTQNKLSTSLCIALLAITCLYSLLLFVITIQKTINGPMLKIILIPYWMLISYWYMTSKNK